MKRLYSKTINPVQFQSKQLSNLLKYQKKMKARAQLFRPNAVDICTSCLICDGKELTTYIKIFGYTYLKCTNCGHINLRERLNRTDLIKFYSQSEEYSETYTDPQQLQYRLSNIAQPKVDFIMSQIENKQGKWLDIGSAIGDILKATEMYPGWSATGLEISTQSIEIGTQHFGVELIKEELRTYCKHTNERYSVVSAFGYYGLLADPILELKRAASLIEDQGYLVIGDSKGDSLSTMIQQAWPNLTLRHLIPPNNIHCFTESSLKLTMKLLDLTPIAMWNFGLDYFEFIKHLALTDTNFFNSDLYKFMFQNANDFQSLIDKKKLGDYFILVAQKNAKVS